jgi:hypothetical protein
MRHPGLSESHSGLKMHRVVTPTGLEGAVTRTFEMTGVLGDACGAPLLPWPEPYTQRSLEHTKAGL